MGENPAANPTQVRYLRTAGAVLEVENVGGALCDAAARNDVQALRRYIENGTDPNEADYDKRTPLHLAASNGSMDAVRRLVAPPGGRCFGVEGF